MPPELGFRSVAVQAAPSAAEPSRIVREQIV